jgi:hypothetical protein
METRNQLLMLYHSWSSFILKKKNHVSNFIYYSAEVDLAQIDHKKDPNDASSLL